MREGWRRLSVADAAVMVKRGRAPVYVEAGGELVFSQKCVRDGRVDDGLARRTDVTKRQVPEWAWVQPGDTLVNSTGRGTVGRAGFVRRLADRATVDSHLTIVRPKPTVVVPEYLGILLHSAKDELEDMASGSTNQTELGADSILAIPILLPPLDEQRRIVDLIAAVDEAIEAAERQLAEVRRYLAALSVELLDGGSDRMTLRDAAEVTIGRQRSPKNVAGEHLVKYLRAANVKDGRLEIDDVLEMNFDPREQATFKLQPGDILVSEGCGSLGQLGASASWHAELPGTVCFQNTLLRLRSKNGVTTPRYLDHLARHAFRSGWWASIASGTNIFHIGLERAKRLPVPVPSLVEQERVTVLLDSISGVTAEVSSLLASLTTLRSALLADLLSGDHEIPVSYDEVLTA